MQVVLRNFARPISLLAAAAVVALAALPARADYYCDTLAAQLAALPRDGGGAPNPGRSNAIAQELNRAQWEARRFNCVQRFFGPPPHPYCRQINAQIAQLRAQLRGSFNSGNWGQGEDWRRGGWQPNPSQGWGARAERQRILAAMASYRCPMPQGGGTGGYRTLCVRTCDGYFFPISFSTGRSRLKIDQAVCKSMYPEGEADLYVHRTGGEEGEQAVSLSGDAYAKQPFAFAYTKQFTPACKSLLTAGLADLAERFKVAQAEKLAADRKNGKVVASTADRPRSPPPMPIARPIAGEDPETLANRAGDFAIEPAKPVVMVDLDEKKPVRIVGGFFYTLPTPEETAAMMKLRRPPRPIAKDGQPVAADMLPNLGDEGPAKVGLP
jgi:hypothetical protein